MQRIILASGSPRRKKILELLGLEFEVVESFYDEDLIKTEDPVELVEELALQKTLKVMKELQGTVPCNDAIIVGGDTIVVLDGEILGKAGSKEEAKQIFGKLLGKTHQVVTGVAVINSLTDERYVGSEQGEVTLREGKEGELEEYVNNETNWRGFAGAYALQGGAAPFAKEQTGKLSAIIGMPIELTTELLEDVGVIVEVEPKELELSLHGKMVGIDN